MSIKHTIMNEKNNRTIAMSDTLCFSCEHNEALYQNICPQCFEKSYIHQVTDINPFDILQYIETLNFKNFTHIRVKEIIDLQRFLIDRIKTQNNFNTIIESKCSCGQINERQLMFKDNPHTVKCKKCKLQFCSNCNLEVHTRKKKYLNCSEYKKIRDIYYGSISQSWLSAILNSKEEHQQVLKNIQNEQKSVTYVSNQDLRQCPYTDYDAAKKYEEDIVSKDRMLTTKYTKDTWYKVACKSDPVVKIDCDDMYCARHNPERLRQLEAQGIKVMLNSKGCGRHINWDYWKKVRPQFDSDIYTKFKKSNVVKCTEAIHENNEKRTCSCCDEESNSFFITCLNHTCKHAYQPICGQCITNFINKVGKKMINIIYDDETIFKLVQEHDGVYRGYAVSPETGDKVWHVYINVDDMTLSSTANSWWFGYFNNLNMHDIENCNNITFEWIDGYRRVVEKSRCIFEDLSSKSLKLYDGLCLQKKHVLHYHGLDELQHTIANYDKWLKETKKSMIITRSIKQYQVRYKFKMMFKIYKIIKNYTVYKKWKQLLKDLTLYMIQNRAATVINVFVHRKLLRLKIYSVVNKYKVFVHNIKNANIINKFMHRLYIYNRWKITIESMQYYTTEKQKFREKNKGAKKLFNDRIKHALAQISMMDKRQKTHALQILNSKKSQFENLINQTNILHDKLLIHYINYDQDKIFANIPYYHKLICATDKMIKDLSENLHSNVNQSRDQINQGTCTLM